MAHERLRPEYSFDQEKIEQLKQLAPECFEDGKINFETLRQNLGDWAQDEDDDTIEHFGLSWPGKRDARKLAAMPATGTLEPVYGEGLKPDGTPDTDGKNDSKNIFIEGENLEVLRILQKSYANRIKMIYIDPPYNTGNDFVYDDDFTEPVQEYLRRTGQVDEEGKPLTTNKRSDGRFHSKWLTMMYPRLRLARNLLKDDGIILVHINKNEITNLTIMLNEIFGEENNLGTIIWDKKNPKGDSTAIAYQHEYILCFVKNKDSLTDKSQIQRPKRNAEKILQKGKKVFDKLGESTYPDLLLSAIDEYDLNENDFKSYRKEYTLEDINEEFSKWIKAQPFSGGEKMYCNIDENGNIYRGVSMAWPNKKSAPKEYKIPLNHPITGEECNMPRTGWRYPPTTIKQLLEDKLILFGDDHLKQPERKYILSENMDENISSIMSDGSSDTSLFSEWKIPFENPKPYKMASDLIKYFSNEQDIVLDFFAGSGTVGHACYELSEYDQSRKFILVQLDALIDPKSQARRLGFETISQISKKRLDKASNNYKSEFDFGYKNFKLDHSSYKTWQNIEGSSVENLQKALEFHSESPLQEDWNVPKLLTETLLIEGFPLDSTIEKEKLEGNTIHTVTHDSLETALKICLDDKINEKLIAKLDLKNNVTFICLDSAISNQDKLRLSDKGFIKTI